MPRSDLDDEGNGDEEVVPEAVGAWLEEILRAEIRAFLADLWDEGEIKEIVRDAVREGASEAVEDVASKQPWRHLLGGEKR